MIKINNESGQMLLLALIVLALVLVNSVLLMNNSFLLSKSSRYTVNELQAINLAEAGADKAVASLNKEGDSYTGDSETFVGPGSYEVEIISKDAGTRIVKATGYIPNKAEAKVTRSVSIQATKGVGVSFVYGIQVGEGGLALGNNNLVKGSIYSNGSVSAGNNNTITGDVWVAGGPQGSSDQSTDCAGVNCNDYSFGKSVNGENRLDVAMSFKPQETQVINKISLKLKKFGSPADVTVRILADNGGKPDKNNVLATGTLYSSLVTTAYSWIDVAFSSTPQLSANTTYWIMIDTTSNSSNYWSWQADSLQSYTRGSAMYSPDWRTGNAVWNATTVDLSFKTIMGGAVTSLKGESNFNISGNAHANTIEGAKITKDAYYQTISDSTVSGNSYPNSVDPPPKIFPISQGNITEWKTQAESNGIVNGDITTCQSTFTSKKVIGNVTFDNGCNVTVQSPIWITGDLILNNSNILTLDSAYAGTSGLIIVDGKVTLGNGNKLNGSGVGSSILMVLSNYDSRTDGVSAVKVNNSGNSGVFYADKGIIEPGNNNSFKELTAWQIKLTNNATIDYETGLSSSLFSSGPSGSFTLVKGSYQLK